MRVVVHMGMHKTGTTSVQKYFHHTPLPGVSYVTSHGSNHSRLFLLMFADPAHVATQGAFTEDGPEAVARLSQERTEAQQAVEAQLHALAGTGHTVIFSAEQISAPPFSEARARMHGFFRGFTDDLTAVGYVRAPLSYAVSAFQQRLRGPQPLDPQALCLLPRYRVRFQQMDALFGRANVHLGRFAPAALRGGDVVSDFAHRIGVTLPGPPPARSNESLSLEATALLYMHRVLGVGRITGVPGALRINRDFDTLLRGIGRTRFTFAPALWEPVLQSRQADLDWIRARLGDPLDDAPPAGQAVAGPADLLAIAERQGPALEALLLVQPDGLLAGPIAAALPSTRLEPRARVLRLLALLRDVASAGHAARMARRARRARRIALA